MQKTQWYAVRTRSRCEFRASEELTEQGIEHYTPSYLNRTLIRHTKGRMKSVHQPLMPGYLLAKLNFNRYSRHPALLDRCRHVIDTVNTPSGMPLPLREKVVTDLKALCMAGKFDTGRARGVDHRFVNGDRVRITSGTWAGFTVTFREVASGMMVPRAGYVTVMLDRLFDRPNFEIDVPHELLEAA